MQSAPDHEFAKRWIPLILAILTGIAGAALGWMSAPSYRIVVAAVAFLLAFLLVALFITLLNSLFSSLSASFQQHLKQVVNRIGHTEEELKSMVNIRPLLGDSVVRFSRWAVDGSTGEQLVLLLRELRADPASTGVIVECGSGTSTVLVARCLKHAGSGRIISLEHKERFAEANRHVLREGGLEEVATVIHAPLRPWPINGQTLPWYDFDLEVHLQRKIDFLIVDGPPGETAPMARYPAVPLLKEWLRPGGVILLHDAHRDDERKIAEKWGQELDVTPKLHPVGKGAWIIRT